MLELVIDPRVQSIGAFDVERILPFRRRRMVGPFIFFDRMGPHQLEGPVSLQGDVRPHPHIGLSTVTYLFDGSLTHRDSLGIEQTIEPGAVNWMTAGSGISHSERFDEMRQQGGRIDGVQGWVALPAEFEEIDPSFEHVDRDDLPVLEEPTWQGRLIAGEAFGCTSPVQTYSPLFYIDLSLSAGASVPLPTQYAERAIYLISGTVEHAGHRYEAGRMLVFAEGSDPKVVALTPAHMMILGGESIGDRHIWWNFVSSNKDRIEQAKSDWVKGHIALPPTDKDDFIPLPAR